MTIFETTGVTESPDGTAISAARGMISDAIELVEGEIASIRCDADGECDNAEQPSA